MRRIKLASGEVRRFARHAGSLGKMRRYGKIAQEPTRSEQDHASEVDGFDCRLKIW